MTGKALCIFFESSLRHATRATSLYTKETLEMFIFSNILPSKHQFIFEKSTVATAITPMKKVRQSGLFSIKLLKYV